jgi:DNA polymerase I-like protein with 3'-5' exonuclease and polymerase domains
MEHKVFTPTGRVAQAEPQMQRIRPPLTAAQQKDVAAFKKAFQPATAALEAADFSTLELRILGSI